MRENVRDRNRLEHIVEAIDRILDFANGKTKEQLEIDKLKYYGIVKNIEKSLLNEVKSGTGKAARQQANQMRKTITNFCSPGNNKQFQMKDVITAPADFVGQEISSGVTTSEPVVEKTSEVLPDW